MRCYSVRVHVSYVVNSLSLDSMLRCLIHILVSAEPMSLVAPGKQKQPHNNQMSFILKNKLMFQNKALFGAMILQNKMPADDITRFSTCICL